MEEASYTLSSREAEHRLKKLRRSERRYRWTRRLFLSVCAGLIALFVLSVQGDTEIDVPYFGMWIVGFWFAYLCLGTSAVLKSLKKNAEHAQVLGHIRDVRAIPFLVEALRQGSDDLVLNIATNLLRCRLNLTENVKLDGKYSVRERTWISSTESAWLEVVKALTNLLSDLKTDEFWILSRAQRECLYTYLLPQRTRVTAAPYTREFALSILKALGNAGDSDALVSVQRILERSEDSLMKEAAQECQSQILLRLKEKHSHRTLLRPALFQSPETLLRPCIESRKVEAHHLVRASLATETESSL